MALTSKWVIAPPQKTLVVKVADMVCSNDASALLVTYSLGSCLGVTVYDPVRKAGGLLHLMLPSSQINPAKAETEPFMFVDTGVPRLFKAVFGLGGEPSRVIVKVAGGGGFLDANNSFNIGERNIAAFRQIVARNGYSIHGDDTGGTRSRTVRFNLSDGSVMISSPGIGSYRL